MGQHSAHQPAVGRTQRSSMWNLKVELTSGPQQFVGSLGHEKIWPIVYNDLWNIQHEYGSSVGKYEPLTTWDMPPRSPKYFFLHIQSLICHEQFSTPAYFLRRSLGTAFSVTCDELHVMNWILFWVQYSIWMIQQETNHMISHIYIWLYIYILYIYIPCYTCTCYTPIITIAYINIWPRPSEAAFRRKVCAWETSWLGLPSMGH